MEKKPEPFSEGWKEKVTNHRQAGGIETSILDNGPGRGMRIAWFNTGSGLRFKVHLDRGMNIADAFFNQYCISWISQFGDCSTDFPREGLDWLDTFNGGLLFTCGLTHVGPPEWDEGTRKGLHGKVGSLKAEVVSIIQPDIRNGDLSMSITGVMRESTVFGPSLELRRTILCTLGDPSVTILDQVTNLGNGLVPHMILYHCNFGWPLTDRGASIYWKGNWHPRDEMPANERFFIPGGYQIGHDVLDEHKGKAETCVFIEAGADQDGVCRCGVRNPSIGKGIQLEFRKDELPYLTHWQHWSKNEFVAALEPGNCFPIGSGRAARDNSLVLLKPGETRRYELRFSITNA